MKSSVQMRASESPLYNLQFTWVESCTSMTTERYREVMRCQKLTYFYKHLFADPSPANCPPPSNSPQTKESFTGCWKDTLKQESDRGQTSNCRIPGESVKKGKLVSTAKIWLIQASTGLEAIFLWV